MKTRNCFFYFIPPLISLIMLVNCASPAKKTDSDIFSDPYGTWINSEYSSIKNKAARIVYNYDGIWAAFDSNASQKPMSIGTISITEKWTDRQGNSWYQVTTNQCGFQFFVYELWKLNRDGSVMEGVWKVGTAPVVLDSGDPTYTIYFRDTQKAFIKQGDDAAKITKNA